LWSFSSSVLPIGPDPNLSRRLGGERDGSRSCKRNAEPREHSEVGVERDPLAATDAKGCQSMPLFGDSPREIARQGDTRRHMKLAVVGQFEQELPGA
jgi:hypothetical protein